MSYRLPGFKRKKTDDNSYRKYYLKDDIVQTRIGIALFIVPAAIFVLKDYALFGLSPLLYGLIALRICLISSYIWLIYKLGRVDNHRQYDKYLFFEAIFVIIAASLINLSRPADYYMFIILDMAVIAVIYTIIPTKLVNQMLLCTLFTIFDILNLVFTRDESVHSMLGTVIPGLLRVNGVGITSSWLLQIFRRGQFAVQCEQEKSRKTLAALALQLQTAQSVTGVGSWTYSPENGDITWSDEMYRIYGAIRTDEKPELKDHARFMSDENWDILLGAINLTVETGTPYELEMEITCPGGVHKTVLSRGQLIHPAATGAPIMIGTSQDITETRRKEKIIEDSLREKEILLKEIQHRVKNNMQIISSLLSIQSQFAVDEKDARMFQDSQDRIHSMSLVYDQLHMDQNLTEISLPEYVNELVNNLINSFSLDAKNISSRVEVDNINVNLDIAIPCGLLVNELVTNSLKHAFPDNRKGIIGISMRKEGSMLKIAVSDNGIGLPENFDISNSPTLGMTLLHTLGAQLVGKVELENNNGTVFHSSFCLNTAG